MRRLFSPYRVSDRIVAVRAALLFVLLFVVIGPAAAAIPPQILVFGDSLAAGFGLPLEAGFPARLEARLAEGGIRARVVNAGGWGDTAAGGLARLDWTLA